MSVRSRSVLVAAALASGLVAVAPAAQAASPPPPAALGLVPIDAAAGYFRVEGACPAKTVQLTISWTGAPNGTGLVKVALDQNGATIPVAVRLLAAAPGQQIPVTIKCIAPSGRASAQWGPTSVDSGNALAAVPADSGTGRRIVYSLSAQQVWAIEADETVARTYLVSGRRLVLAQKVQQPGSFTVQRKMRYWCVATACHYFVAFHKATYGWLGFHQIPLHRGKFDQPTTELGQPRSDGCAREAPEDAIWLFDWAQVGDPVVVLP